MTSYGQWRFTWDAENRLALASNTVSGLTVSNTYDYMSRRVSKTTQQLNNPATEIRFLYQGWAMFEENTSSATNHYIYGLDLSGTPQGAGTIGGILAANFNGTTAFYAYDANGNVADLVGTNGQLLAQYQYDPYGNTISKSGALADVNTFRFSTKYLDVETGLLYCGYRYFCPEIGRWASRDPIMDPAFRNLASRLSLTADIRNKFQQRRPPSPVPVLTPIFVSVSTGAGAKWIAFPIMSSPSSSIVGSVYDLQSGEEYVYCANDSVGYVDPLGLMITWKGFAGAVAELTGGLLCLRGAVTPGVLLMCAGGGLACWEIAENKELLDKIHDWIKSLNKDSDGDGIPDRCNNCNPPDDPLFPK
jgi:RHS repeat-associated protein